MESIYRSHNPRLDALGQAFVERVVAEVSGAKEGDVLTSGPPPYRRVDCDGRALVYVRSRPRKLGVRVDVSGLWVVARTSSPLLERSASGAVTLWIERVEDVLEAAAFVRDAVAYTRYCERWRAERELGLPRFDDMPSGPLA